MKKLWDPIVETAEDIQKTASRLVDDGLKFFQGHLGRIPLFSCTAAVVGADDLGRDETHYFLVPNRAVPTGYCLYSARVLPQGVGPENNLPKAKIFQLPGEGTESHLTKLLLGELKEETLGDTNIDSPLADRLDVIAEEVDRQCNLVSGGLLLVGGVVAIANPIVGVGIAAKALIPGLGSKLSVQGIKHASDWFRSRKESAAEDDATKKAKAEVKKLKPEIRINEILVLLEKALSTSDSSFDPGMASGNLMNDLNQISDLRLGAQALSAVYNTSLELDPGLRAWIRSLEESLLS